MTSLECAKAMAGLPRYVLILMCPISEMSQLSQYPGFTNMQDVMVMGLVSMAPASSLKMEAMSAIVMKAGMV